MPPGTNKTSREKALVAVRFSAMGDVAMAVSVVAEACRALSPLKIVFVTRKPFGKLFVSHPDNLVVVEADLKQQHRGISGMKKLLDEISEKYDIVALADLHSVLRTHALRFFARLHSIPVARIHKGRKDKKRLTRLGASAFGHKLPTSIERYRDVFTRLGYLPGALPPSPRAPLPPPPLADCDIAARRKDDEIWIGIAPFAAHKGKIWPLDNMETLVKMLAAKGYRLWLFGAGDKETETLDRMASGHENIVNVAALKLGLTKELRLIASLNLMVSMDSGNMHLAELMSTPCVSIWGATHPAAGFANIGDDPARQIGLDLKCRPCSVYGDKPCRFNDFHCLTDISPRMVETVIEKALFSSPQNSYRKN